MGKPTGFIEYDRVDVLYRPVEERVGDFRHVAMLPPWDSARTQASRCMDCGIPFCHSGCPLGNQIPDWNDLVHRGDWARAYQALRETNNFPEFTGQVCPAPCEAACVAGIGGEPVAIEQIEWAIAERAFEDGIAKAHPPAQRTGRRVAVVGSGPAGLACADQLNQAGHEVVVFERDAKPGGLLRYGIPDFKLEKWVVERRIQLLTAEGVRFVTGVEVGTEVTAEDLEAFDAVVLCTGSTVPRDLPVPGRDLNGIHPAMDFLAAQNRVVGGEAEEVPPGLSAAGRHVIVIGGGDTGSDCVGTANRQGAASVTQFELLPMLPSGRPAHQPWPYFPMKLKTTTSHEEGADRHWSLMTTAFTGDDDVRGLRTVIVNDQLQSAPGSEREWKADLVLLAVGYVGTENPLLEALGLVATPRGTVGSGDFTTSREGYFAAGDARRGQSLVVWAISEGREAAAAVDEYLMGSTRLARKGDGDLPRK
ncbi:MAG: glutamate synthase subunit beta [Rhodothermales bacterium]|nr:glutamate synthase subunit beta [Rhodothermales bacterium]MBO6779372.1 glutamate synthase subunit beta [Rhodothermales bacterium]